MIVQHRHEYFSMELFFQRVPVDIEKASVNRSLAIFQNVEPPHIVTPHHSHVIGDDIENQTHPMFVESSYKAVEVFGSADLRVERVVVDDVVSVHAARTSLEARRNVTVADAERGKIWNDRLRLCKSKIAIQLKAISCARSLRAWLHASRNHNTDHAGSFPCCTSISFPPSLA